LDLKTNIITEIKSGNDDVLMDIYKKYRNDFIRWAVANYNVTVEESKDVFQDILTAFYQNILSGRLTELNCELRTFLFQLGKFKLINIKKRELHKLRYEEETLYVTPTGIEPIYDFYNEKHFHYNLSNYLNHLCDNCRMMIELFYIKELPLKQIAIMMGYKNEDVAKNKRYECFKKLTVIYQKEKQSGERR